MQSHLKCGQCINCKRIVKAAARHLLGVDEQCPPQPPQRQRGQLMCAREWIPSSAPAARRANADQRCSNSSSGHSKTHRLQR